MEFLKRAIELIIQLQAGHLFSLCQSSACIHPADAACRVLQIRTLCLAPHGGLLLAIDNDGKSLLISRKRQALLHHFSFKGPVAAAKFSPDGTFIAAAVGRLLQVSQPSCISRAL